MQDMIGRGATAASAVAAVARRLSQAGVDRPRSEADALVRTALDLSREGLLLRPEAQLSAPQRRRLEALATRRARREPLPYIVGETEFYSLSLRVSPSAIVPRQETEILVDAAIGRAARTGARVAADLGTGCGAIAVALACHLPHLRVIAADVSLAALLLAAENCRRNGVAGRVSLLCSDLLSGLRAPVDCIAANLPYVCTGQFDSLQPEVRDFEPRLGLDGGPDGLGPIKRLSAQLINHLSEGGFAALEVGAGQAPQVAKLLRAGRLSEVETIADYAGIPRVVIGWRRE